ncbi:MAG: methyltransferase domain-containing protein [Planctomycetes bacterium]|nr:methyltransferase domain-containing protein [Planctomycetota bacterium]
MSEEGAYHRHLHSNRGDAARSHEGYAVWFDATLPSQRARALDFGAGLGAGVDYLRASGFRAVESFDTRVELSASLAERVDKAHVSNDPRAWLATQAGRYDLILAKDVVEHLAHEETLPTVEALLGALAPGGRLVVSVPHAVSFTGVYLRYGDFTHRTAFTESSLRYVLEASGGAGVQFYGPKFEFRWSPKTIAYRALKKAWFGVLKGIYYLETPSLDAIPSHFHPRLVATAERG